MCVLQQNYKINILYQNIKVLLIRTISDANECYSSTWTNIILHIMLFIVLSTLYWTYLSNMGAGPRYLPIISEV